MCQCSKLFRVVLLFLFSQVIFSCEKEGFDVIPDVYVDFSIRLDDPEFQALNAVGNSVVVTYAYNGYRSAGFDRNGIIIYRAGTDEFYAFDTTCPYDYAEFGESIAVGVESPGDLYAVCPECASEYVLPGYGSPTDKSISGYPLKTYRTSFNGLYLKVYH